MQRMVVLRVKLRVELRKLKPVMQNHVQSIVMVLGVIGVPVVRPVVEENK